MGLFSKRPRPPFWHSPPISARDPQALHQYAIYECVGRDDFTGMMATGWAIWDLADIGSHQAADLLTDGYRGWEQQAGFDRALGRQFLEEALDRLASDPALPGEIMGLPREVVDPVAIHYGTRCWLASELVDAVDDPSAEARAFDLIRRSPQPFVPPRSMNWARAFAEQHGLPEPWV